jgi:hypothetical protein
MVQFRCMFLKRAAFAALLVLAFPYVRGPVYDFPPGVAFSGTQLLNPYQNARHSWLRSNFHAHGRPWGGLTNGRQSDADIVRTYESFGYAVAGVSNYQHIAAAHGAETIPIYEHGYNLVKRHQLAIGARSVTWFDFPLWQTLSNQQYVIDRVAATADLVALAHPYSRDAYALEDLRQLTGYQLIEVINGPFLFEDSWDAALSAGRIVWGLGDDDTHDLLDSRRTAVAWTMVNARSNETADVVARTNDSASAIETRLGEVIVRDGTLHVTSVGDPSTFIFVGQNGAVRKTVKYVTAASYEFAHDDSYIRTVIRSPRTAMFLNPVFRHDGTGQPPLSAQIDTPGTWLFRGGLILVCIALGFLYRDRRRPAVGRSARPVLAPADRKTA